MLVLFLNCQPLVCLFEVFFVSCCSCFLRFLPLSQFESNLCSGEWRAGLFGTSEAEGVVGRPGFEQNQAKKLARFEFQLSLLMYKVGSVTLYRVVVKTKLN